MIHSGGYLLSLEVAKAMMAPALAIAFDIVLQPSRAQLATPTRKINPSVTALARDPDDRTVLS